MDIAVIDYKMSNVFSVKNALNHLGFNGQITSNSKTIMEADGAVLPGVGSFPEAMQRLYDLRLIDVIKEYVSSGKPFMGICLGLQLLFSRSDEFDECEGLNIIDGKVENFSKHHVTEPIPHVGWNTVVNYKHGDNNTIARSRRPRFYDHEYFYFVHSLFVEPDDRDCVFTETCFANHRFCSSVLSDNIFACQFHPEKSGKRGLDILNDFFKTGNS